MVSHSGPEPTDPVLRRHGWHRTLLVALLVAGLTLVGAGGAGFAAGRLLAGGDGPVRCATWDFSRCIPGLDLEAVLETLAERGFECERLEWEGFRELVGDSTESDQCSLGGYRTRFESLDGQVRSVTASVPVLPGVSLTQRQATFLSWVAVLPFSDQPVSAEAASGWLSRQLADGRDGRADIDGYDYSIRYPGQGRRTVVVLEVDAGLGGWFR